MILIALYFVFEEDEPPFKNNKTPNIARPIPHAASNTPKIIVVNHLSYKYFLVIVSGWSLESHKYSHLTPLFSYCVEKELALEAARQLYN